MTQAQAMDLKQAIEHDAFPDLDLALRRGRHIDRDDASWYALLVDAQPELERFYRRFGAELVHRSDGYFFLLPTGDKLGRRHLASGDMLVGQALTLLFLDPATVEQAGLTTRDQVLSTLSAAMGSDALIAAFNPAKKQRRLDERIAHENVRARVSEAVRRLASLGFVELLSEERLRMRASLLRFAEPVRGSQGEAEALARLLASGEIMLAQDVVEGQTEGAAEASDFEADAARAEASDDNDFEPDKSNAELASVDSAGARLRSFDPDRPYTSEELIGDESFLGSDDYLSHYGTNDGALDAAPFDSDADAALSETEDALPRFPDSADSDSAAGREPEIALAGATEDAFPRFPDSAAPDSAAPDSAAGRAPEVTLAGAAEPRPPFNDDALLDTPLSEDPLSETEEAALVDLPRTGALSDADPLLERPPSAEPEDEAT